MAKLTIQSDSSLDTSNLKAIEKVGSCLYEMGRIEVLQLTAIPGLKLEENFRDLRASTSYTVYWRSRRCHYIFDP